MKRSWIKRGKPLKKRAKKSRSVIPAKVRKEVRERSGGICEFTWEGPRCTNTAHEMHHVLARSQGGKHTPDNLMDSCFPCHVRAKDQAKEAIRRGFVKLMTSFEYSPSQTMNQP